MSKPYKDKMGRWRTQSLFKEFYLKGELKPVFTLKEFDDTDDTGATLPSMRQLFLSYKDPTGYLFSKEILGSYEHWKRLLSLSWFKPHVEDWLMELEVSIAADSLQKIKDVADGDSKSSFAAARFLAEKGWKDKGTKGRPRKEDIKREAQILAGVEAAVEDDLERIRVVK